MKITTEFSKDVADYFNDTLIYKELVQTPLIAFVVGEGGETSVQLVNRPKKVRELPDSTVMIGQWQKQYISGWFEFTAAQVKNWLDTHNM